MWFSLSLGVLAGCGDSNVTFFFFLGALFGLGCDRGDDRVAVVLEFDVRLFGDGFVLCGGVVFDVETLLVTLLVVGLGPSTDGIVDDLEDAVVEIADFLVGLVGADEDEVEDALEEGLDEKAACVDVLFLEEAIVDEVAVDNEDALMAEVVELVVVVVVVVVVDEDVLVVDVEEEEEEG